MEEAEDRLSLPRPRWANAEIAVWGGDSEDDLALAGGYLRVAETAARHWVAHGPDDLLPLPILYNYRHSIELSLKWLIRKAAQCALREGYTGEEDLSPDQLDKRLRTHNIRRLADCLNRYLALLDLPKVEQRIDPESWSQTELAGQRGCDGGDLPTPWSATAPAGLPPGPCSRTSTSMSR